MIRLININKIYQTKTDRVIALNNINLHVNKGEIFGVMGKSGAGKSTLIRCVNLLERPSCGEVIVDGQNLMQLSNKALRQCRHQIGMIFQHFNLMTTRTVVENISFPLELMNENKNVIAEKVAELLQLTGLAGRRDAYPSQLSGGQKQRVAIARALATNPKILLCDEMTSSLDPETTASILQLIKDIKQKLDLSILLITHEMDVIKRIADRAAVIDQGEIIECQDVVALFKNPQTHIAKTFTRSVFHCELPQELAQHLQTQPIANGYVFLRIAFVGEKTQEPVIANLIRKEQVDVNILQANLEYLQRETVGMMLVAIKADPTKIQNIIRELTSKNIQVEVLGYVESTIFITH